MGTTYYGIHVFSPEPFTCRKHSFLCFSPDWQTYIPDDPELSDPEYTQKLARSISKTTDAPVLWFYEFDEEAIYFKFYIAGKQFACFNGGSDTPNKNLYQIPGLVGYESGSKRRLSKILSCSDVDFQITLLEEFFGVCLLPLPELLDEGPSALVRHRGDHRYQEYIEEEKQITGKHAPIKAELVQELEGILTPSDWHYDWFENTHSYLPNFKPHYYLYYKKQTTDAERIPARFHNGRISFISNEEMQRDGADKPYPHDCRCHGYHPGYIQEFLPSRLIFTEAAPAAYQGKEFRCPRGLYGLGFDAKSHLILYDDAKTFYVMNEDFQIIAKQRLKGVIWVMDGDYILACEQKWIWGTIRVYRIVDK